MKLPLPLIPFDLFLLLCNEYGASASFESEHDAITVTSHERHSAFNHRQLILHSNGCSGDINKR